MGLGFKDLGLGSVVFGIDLEVSGVGSKVWGLGEMGGARLRGFGRTGRRPRPLIWWFGGWFGGVRCTAFRVDLGIEELQIHKLKSNNFFGYLFFCKSKEKIKFEVRGAIF